MSRAAVFPPGAVNGNGDQDVCASAMLALQRALAAAGMPAGHVAMFADLLWRCGPNLDSRPRLGVMAADWGVSRAALAEKITGWADRGLCERHREGKGGQYRFSFPSHAELVAVVRAGWKARALTGVRPGPSAQGKPGALAGKNGGGLFRPEEGEAKAKPKAKPKPKAKAKPDKPGGRLLAAWIDGFRERTGRTPGPRDRAKIGKLLKGAVADGTPERDVGAAIGRWFGADRERYDVGIFLSRLKGGDAELWGRSSGTRRRGRVFVPTALEPDSERGVKDFSKGVP